MKDEKPPRNPGDPIPTIIRGLKVEDLFARGMQTQKVPASKDAGTWRPPSVEEVKRLFPGYEIISLLGHGGMGAVYKGRQLSLDRFVAIKLLPLEVNRDREFADRFTREAQTMARLHHTNLVALYNFGQTVEGHLYYVMEYVEGTTLHEASRTKPLSPQRIVRVLGQVCDGLACAHRDGVVHRDIKPANILVDSNDVAKVADFGLARSARHSSGQALTIKGMAVGTPDYMSPEQRRGDRVDQRTDIYALGVVLYEALTNRLPRDVFRPASQISGTPAALDAVISRALHPDPEKRFQSTMEMKAALDRAFSNGGVASPQPAAGPRQHLQASDKSKPVRSFQRESTKRGSESKASLWVTVAASVLVLAAAGFAFLRPSIPTSTFRGQPQPTPAAPAAPSLEPPAPVVARAPEPTPSAARPLAPETKPLSFGDSRYQLIRSQASWMQAKTEAEFKGGHLAAITSPQEAEWIRKAFGPELAGRFDRIWIGAYQADRDDAWHWVTDEEFKFTDWHGGQPDMAKTDAAPPFCAALSRSSEVSNSVGWDDSLPTGGASIVGYIIEWDEPKPAVTSPPVAMASPVPEKMTSSSPSPTPVPAPTPAPAGREGEQRLAFHKAQFDAAYARDIASIDTARDAARKNYQAAIDREIDKASQAGKFTEVSALREERVRAAISQVQDASPALPALLQPLRATFRATLARLEVDRAAKLKPLREGYLKLLDASLAEFTRAQNQQAALVLKAERDKLSTEWASETPPPSPGEPNPDGSPQEGASSWRRVAQLALRFGGRVDIEVEGRRIPITTDLDIPNRRFEVVRLEFNDEQQNQNLSDADFAPIGSCRKLEEFRISRAPITSKGLECLRGLQLLRTLGISYCPQVSDEVMPIVASLSELRSLDLVHTGITKGGLKHLQRASKLNRLSLHGDQFTASALATVGTLPVEELSLSELGNPASLDLGGFRNLKRLFVSSMREGKKRLVDEAAKMRKLETIRFSNCDLGDDDLTKLATLSNLKTLEIEGSTIQGSGLSHLRSCRSLESLRLHNCGITNAALEVIGRDLSALRILKLTGSAQVQAPAFRSLAKCRGLKEMHADGLADNDVASELALINGLEVVSLNNSPSLGDAGLQALVRLKSLKRLQINNCGGLTPANVKTFQRARPDVAVDFTPPAGP